MFVYAVIYRDSFEAVYDEETFKYKYKEYLDKDEKYWKSLYDVGRIKLNTGMNDESSHWVYPEDMK
jgi:hypothetical protein